MEQSSNENPQNLLKATPPIPTQNHQHLLSLCPELGSFLLPGPFLRKPRVPQASTDFHWVR